MKQRWLFLVASLAVIVGVVALASGAAGSAGRGAYRLMTVFGQVVSLVRSSYVEEVPIEKLELGALGGLVEAADPGGMWVPDDVAAEYARVRAREIPPLGLVLGKRSSYPFVLQVLADSPAAKAGIVPGELIERIGSQPVRARPLWRALLLLDAAEHGGADVTLDVIDRQLTGKRPITLKPGAVAAPAPGSDVRNGIVVARLPVVDREGAAGLGRSLHGAASGIVVDLRGVALGTPDGAAQAAALIAGGDAELTLQMRGGKQETVKAHGAPRSWKVVVCLDGTTAGPAELLAGLLRSRGALLVGGETYGDTGQRRAIKGSGGVAWLAQQWGVAPGGGALLGTGLKPDERIRPRKDGDAALERALELAGGAALAKQAA